MLGGLLCIELEELELEELELEELELAELEAEELELEELIGGLLALGMFAVCCAMRIGEQEERITTANQDSRIGASR